MHLSSLGKKKKKKKRNPCRLKSHAQGQTLLTMPPLSLQPIKFLAGDKTGEWMQRTGKKRAQIILPDFVLGNLPSSFQREMLKSYTTNNPLNSTITGYLSSLTFKTIATTELLH